MPYFRCKDIGMQCGFEAKAFTKGSLMNKIAEHAAKVHDIKEISPELKEKIEKAIT